MWEGGGGEETLKSEGVGNVRLGFLLLDSDARWCTCCPKDGGKINMWRTPKSVTSETSHEARGSLKFSPPLFPLLHPLQPLNIFCAHGSWDFEAVSGP